MIVYRASQPNEQIGEHFALDLNEATAYRHNEPFGGPQMYRADAGGLSLLDLREALHDFLNEIIGERWENDYEWCAAWALEDQAVQDYLADHDYDGIRYEDDYPNGADVIYIPAGLDMEPIEIGIREGLADALENIEQYRAVSLHRYAAEYVAGRASNDDGDQPAANDLDLNQVISLLTTGSAEDGDFTLTLVEGENAARV